MKKIYLVVLLGLLMGPMMGWGQTSTQNFGTLTGSNSSQTGSTATIPNPTLGTTYARAGAAAASATINLATASNPLGTNGAYMRGVASTSGSVSKVSPIVSYTNGLEFFTSFKVLFGNASAGNTATSGTWTFYQGAGAAYADNTDAATTQVFTGLRFTFGAAGALTLTYNNNGTYNSTGLTTSTFSQSTIYTIEIIGNNKTSGTISYTYSGAAQTVAVQKFDLYINGTLVGNDLTKGTLPSNTSINAMTFTGVNSTSNAANIFIDDVNVYNAVPAAIAVPTYTITYNGNSSTGGSVPVDASSPYVSGATVTVKANTGSLVRTGYSFNGWNTAANGTGTAYAATGLVTFTMPAVNRILYAQWVVATSPVLAITGTPTNQGSVCPGTEATSVVYTITNSSTVQADGITVLSSDAQFVVSGLSSTTIAANNGTATYTVTFTPASAGAKSATITVASTTSGSNSPTSSLTGTGKTSVTQVVSSSAATGVSFSTATLNGNVTTLGVCPASTEKGFVYAVTATNGTPVVGGTGVTKVAVGSIGTGAFTNALTGLPSSTSHSFRAYVFDGTTYVYGTVLTFTTLNALTLSGTLAHGSVCPGFSTAAQTYTITNNSVATVTGLVVGSNNSDFVVSGLSSTSIAAGGTATYQVTFSPATSGAKTAIISVSSADAATVSNTVTGIGTTIVVQAVTSSASTVVVNTTATLNGNVNTLGVCPSTTEKGFVYSQTATNGDPLVSGTGVTKTTVAGVATGIYNLPLTGLATGTGYSFKAYVYNGTSYTYGAVQTFTTLLPADRLTFVGVPATGNVGANLTSFTVEARRPDNSVDNAYTGNITISKATGAGVLSGTLTVAAVAGGVATFNTAQFDAADTYTISAASGSLTGTTSGNIVVSLVPSVIAQFNFTTSPFLPFTFKNANVNVTDMALSSGTISTGVTTGTIFPNEPYIEGGGGWTSSAQATAKNFNFTITANSGYEIEITSFEFNALATPAGPSAISYNISSGLATFTTNAPDGSLVSVNQTITGVNAQTTVPILIQGWLNGSRTSSGAGAFRLDDVIVKGYVRLATPTVNISNTGTPASGNIQLNSTNVVLSAFNLSPNNSTDFTAVSITKTGTTTTDDLDNVRIFYDADGNGLINGAEASVSGAGIALANAMNFTITGQTGFSTSRRYLVVADVLTAATLSRTVTTSIAAASDVTTSITNKTGTAIGNVQTIAYVTSATGYFRSAVVNGNWNTVASWESSNDNITYFASTLAPTSSATAINIRNGHTIVINAAGISMTNTTVENGGTIEITTSSSFDLSGAVSGSIQLTIKSGGSFLVNCASTFVLPTGNALGLVETGGKLIAGPLMGSTPSSSTGTNFADAYLGRTSGLFYFGNEAICEWQSSYTTLGSASTIDADFFLPYNTIDMPVFRVVTSPAFEFGSTLVNNIFNSVLEVVSPAVFQIGKGSSSGSLGTKTFIGGIRGTGTVTQNATPSPANTGNIILGDGTNVPVLDGSLTLNIQDNRLKLPNGASVPSGAIFKIVSGTQNNRVERQGGNITINGTLDITNLRITNTSTGGVIVNGTLKSSNTGGIYGTGSAIVSGVLTINDGSIIEYNANVDQAITGSLNYYSITFSGAGVKTPSSAIYVNALGTVKITGTCTVDGTTWNIGTAGAATNFIMDGGRFRIGVGGTQPNMDGTYDISGGIVEFQGTSAKTIRSKSYQNIEVTGNNVGTSSSVISLNDLGTFTIKNGGVFIGSNPNASIVGPTGTQSFTMESNSIFRCAIESGFYGPVAGFGLPSPSVRTDIETINLNTGSTIEYARESGVLPGTASSGNQVITIPVSGGSAIPYQNLLIGGNGTKTASSATLAIQGNLTKSGTSTFNPNGGLVLLNGSSAQSFAGLDFYGLEMTGGTKATNGNASIEDVVKINSNAILSISAGETVTLKSSSKRTARIDQLLHADPSTAINYNGTGKFIVERALINARKWRLLSAPTQRADQTIKNSWQEGGAYVPGYGFKALDTRTDWSARGFDALGNNSSVKKFSPVTESWDAVDNTNTSLINTQRGYMVFVSGDFSTTYPNSNETNLRTSGQLYTGTRPTINIPADSFAVIGNPYASRINLKNVAITGTGTDQSVYVWDPTLTSNYGLGAFNTLYKDGLDYRNLLASATYGSANSLNNFIESGQAFMVRATTASTIIFDENDKTDGSDLSSFTAGAPQWLSANLNLVPATGSPILLDGVKADFDENATNSINEFDIEKIPTFNESVSWKSNNSMIVIDRRAMIVNNDTLHLQTSNYKVQNYQWEIITNNLDFPGRTGFLLDRYLNTTTPLNMSGTTTVNFNVANVAGSYAADRFKIVFRQDAAGPLPVTFTTVTANRNADRSVAVQWKVEQEINIVAYEVERSKNGSNFTTTHNRTAAGNNSSSVIYNHIDLTAFSGDNFYRIKATSVGGQVQYSNIVKLNGSKATPLISVYPNPVVNKQLQLRFEEQEKGRYQVQLMNMKGQVLVNKTVNVLNTVQAETIELSASLAAGNYQLVVTAPNGNRTKQTVLVQ